jgi:hypothetical protein
VRLCTECFVLVQSLPRSTDTRRAIHCVKWRKLVKPSSQKVLDLLFEFLKARCTVRYSLGGFASSYEFSLVHRSGTGAGKVLVHPHSGESRCIGCDKLCCIEDIGINRSSGKRRRGSVTCWIATDCACVVRGNLAKAYLFRMRNCQAGALLQLQIPNEEVKCMKLFKARKSRMESQTCLE